MMSDLFDPTIVLELPELLAVSGHVGGNLIYRIGRSEHKVDARLGQITVRGRTFWRATTTDNRLIAIVDVPSTSTFGCDAVLWVQDTSSVESIIASLSARTGKWLWPKPRKPEGLNSDRDGIMSSWKDSFQLVTEEYEGQRLVRNGLRPPQAGAIHATKAHWSVSSQPATLVLPTGTGKTDTMAALLVSEQISCLLVIVPTDPLRRQISRKFATLDVLRKAGLIAADTAGPAVSMLTKGLKSKDDILALVAESNVIVATMSVLSTMSAELRTYLAAQVSHLFVDEAHYVGAKTWKEFKQLFHDKLVLQFTATPYRNDSKRVDGRFIYVYPLRRAQSDGLFAPITYVPIRGNGLDDTHTRIIEAVGVQLAQDRKDGFKHLAMARADGVAQAEALHKRYCAALPQHNPRLIHNGISSKEREVALVDLREGRSDIIVCVDMLGEGFDLPDLKIAALHDKHKSEAVTLQFVGRFTRARSDLGGATVIANVAITDVASQLNSLYAEDADWNQVLSVIGHTRTERERRREDLFSGFTEDAEQFALETLEPRLSTSVYRTSCDEWTPEGADQTFHPLTTIVEAPLVNPEHRILVFVQRDEERLRWTSVRSVRNVAYNMVMAHWDAEQNLLFLHCSDMSAPMTDLAKAITGGTAQIISGEQVFRVLQGFRRLMLTNLGLSETQRKPVRYSQFMGSDIADQLDTLPGNRSRSKTNLFGLGYIDVEHFDDADKVVARSASKETIGCSRKGKFWSYQTTNSFAEWIS